MIEIDGSQGEGGGQVIRSSLTLSAVTGKPFRIINIRAGRKKSGLKRQHVTAVHAAREICGAGVTGAELNSSELTFAPGKIQTRGFHFKIGSAGSATLVAQTVLPALMLADGESCVTVEGGTHNRGAPPFDFLTSVFLPQLQKMGPQFRAELFSHGFYPVGGGKFTISISPVAVLKPLRLVESKQEPEIYARALVSQLPLEIAERELEVIRRKAGLNQNRCRAVAVKNSPGPGNVVMIEILRGNVSELVTGFGEKGVPAEKVARNAWRHAKSYLETGAPVSEHLADQLLLPMGLATLYGQSSSFVTGPLSLHSTTHIDILKKFLSLQVTVSGQADRTSLVEVSP